MNKKIFILLIIIIVVVALGFSLYKFYNPQNWWKSEQQKQGSEKELGCINSGGVIFETACYCSGVSDFPNNCEIGGCTCNPAASGVSYQIRSCDCGDGKCFDGERCVNFPY